MVYLLFVVNLFCRCFRKVCFELERFDLGVVFVEGGMSLCVVCLEVLCLFIIGIFVLV